MTAPAADLSTRLEVIEQRLATQEATYRAELVALRRQLAQRRRNFRVRALATMLVALLLLTPLGALAANFVDLNPGSAHNPNINAIADAGITRGCFDTSHYCPNDFVTREQMASFLARTAGLGANPPVTNAAQLGGVPASGYLRPVGNFVLFVAPAGAVPDDPQVSILADRGIAKVKSSATGNYAMSLPLPGPGSLFGTEFRVATVEICYRTSNAATFINSTILYYVRAFDTLQGPVDSTDRSGTSFSCFTLTEPATTPTDGGPAIKFFLSFANTAHQIELTKVTATFAPVP